MLLLAGLSLSRCNKGYGPLDTTLTIYPSVQVEQSGDSLRLEGWKGYYYFPADTATYWVSSYQNALDGVFSRQYADGDFNSQTAEVNGSKWVRFPNINSTSAMLLVVYPDDSLYAWRPMNFVDGLDSMTVRLVFKRWQTDSVDTKSGKWNIVLKNKKTIAPVYLPAYQVNASVVEKAGEKPTKITTWRGYYYTVEHTDYKVASLSDAKERVLTPTVEGGEKLTEKSVDAENKATNYIRFQKLKKSTLMLVIYDVGKEVYAYRPYEVDEEVKELVMTDLTFRTYETGQYKENGWTVVITDPKEPDPDPAPVTPAE